MNPGNVPSSPSPSPPTLSLSFRPQGREAPPRRRRPLLVQNRDDVEVKKTTKQKPPLGAGRRRRRIDRFDGLGNAEKTTDSLKTKTANGPKEVGSGERSPKVEVAAKNNLLGRSITALTNFLVAAKKYLAKIVPSPMGVMGGSLGFAAASQVVAITTNAGLACAVLFAVASAALVQQTCFAIVSCAKIAWTGVREQCRWFKDIGFQKLAEVSATGSRHLEQIASSVSKIRSSLVPELARQCSEPIVVGGIGGVATGIGCCVAGTAALPAISAGFASAAVISGSAFVGRKCGWPVLIAVCGWMLLGVGFAFLSYCSGWMLQYLFQKNILARDAASKG